MRITSLIFLFASVWWPIHAVAQDASDPQKVADAIIRFCLEGGRIEAGAGNDLLVSSAGVGGILAINQQGLEDLVGGIKSAVGSVRPDQLGKASACLQPLLQQVLTPDQALRFPPEQQQELNPFPRKTAPKDFGTLHRYPPLEFWGEYPFEGGPKAYPAAPCCSSPGVPETETGHTETTGPVLVLASRTFAGPDQYPPQQFAAYGIVAFTSQAMDEDIARYQMICNAYVASLLSPSEIPAPTEKQMVTVWPIERDDEANHINAMPRGDELCKQAVQNYGLWMALKEINLAKYSRARLDGPGPFLLAWSPSRDIGQPDAPVLVSNLSNVTTFEQAKEMFLRWSHDIVENPNLWRNGWNLQTLRIEIQLWADKWGSNALKVFGVASK